MLEDIKLKNLMDIRLNIGQIIFILIVLALFIPLESVRVAGDTEALIKGLDVAISCITWRHVTVPCGAGVVHFPIFQYLIALPIKLTGFSDKNIIYIFGYISTISFFVACIAYMKIGYIAGGKKGAACGLLLLVSGYMLWYMASTFNEATTFTLFSLLALSIIDKWKYSYTAILALLCTLTKEISIPIVIYFIFLSVVVTQYRLNLNKDFFRSFIKDYKYTFICVMLGGIINSLFNYFRFQSFKNIVNLDPIFMTPSKYVSDLFYNLFFSPSGGLLFVWFSLISFIIVGLIFCNNNRKVLIGLAILPIIIINWGLSHWYSPFGAIAWGPRLTLPYLGAIGIILLFIIVPSFTSIVNKFKRYIGFVLILVVSYISALPNIAAGLNSPIFLNAIYAPTKTILEINIQPFAVQLVPPDIYMKAVLEVWERSSIIPGINQVVSNNNLYFFYWFIFFIILSNYIFKKPV
jgi:hypothetical protein